MIRLRPFLEKDTEKILSMCKDEKEFYLWTAGVLGDYPLKKESFDSLKNVIRFTALDDKEVCGFFTMRNPLPTADELRVGFVIVAPEKRGRGYGKEMLRLASEYAANIYKAKILSLGVFENNLPAIKCYESAGFKMSQTAPPELYNVLGETKKVFRMEKIL